MARGLMALAGHGSGGEHAGAVFSSSGALFLLGMIVVSLSIISMVVFACADGRKHSTSHRKKKKDDFDYRCFDFLSRNCGDCCGGGDPRKNRPANDVDCGEVCSGCFDILAGNPSDYGGVDCGAGCGAAGGGGGDGGCGGGGGDGGCGGGGGGAC